VVASLSLPIEIVSYSHEARRIAIAINIPRLPKLLRKSEPE
jgi:hypothetical protein